MKGEAQVIERLNEALFLELGAVNQYWVHYRLLHDWGYQKLAGKERAESIEEMQHAERAKKWTEADSIPRAQQRRQRDEIKERVSCQQQDILDLSHLPLRAVSGAAPHSIDDRVYRRNR